MTNLFAVRMPSVVVRVLVLAGLSLAAVAADVSVAAAQPGEGLEAMQRMFSDPALRDYRLSTENLDKFVRATNALKTLEDEDIDIEDHVNMDDPEKLNVGVIAAAFDNEPRIKSAINSAGMTSRDYVTFLFAMMQAMFASVVMQMGGEQALANFSSSSTLKANIEFFNANQEAFQALNDDN